MKKKRDPESDRLRPEYNFDYSGAVRGKYFQRLMKEGSNLVILEPDIAGIFPDSAAVNEALRSFIEVSNITRRLKVKRGGKTTG